MARHASRNVFHPERHARHRIGWLRAAVLGANDGLVSTSSLVLGFVSAEAARSDVFLAGIAGLVAGAMSMAAGEYVSVSSQADAERADLARERRELEEDPEFELQELASIYEGRGLAPDLALEVARALMARDPLEAHARDELGITDTLTARPVQAALSSAATFAGGALIPLLALALAHPDDPALGVALASLFALALFGALGARAGGAPAWRGALRVTFWGTLAMAVTSAAGSLFGALPP